MAGSAFEFTDAHRVVLVNLAQAYDAWLEAARRAAALDFVLQVKRQSYKEEAYEYLYRMTDAGKGLGNSLGRLTPELAALRARHQQMKEAALAEEKSRYERTLLECRQYRALRLGTIASEAARILRVMDVYGFTGNRYMVVGTNAMAVYEAEAGARFAADVEATEDFDMTWSAGKITLFAGVPPPSPWDPAALLGLEPDDPLLPLLNQPPKSLRALLKLIDATYTKNSERPFQIRNAKGYEVEVLLAKKLVREFPREEELAPIPFEEQDWLLEGHQIVHAISARDNTPARVIAPDPRWFGLQKLWLAEKPQRNALKKPKDHRQGLLVLDAVREYMPHYPLDAAFAAVLPGALAPHFDAWERRPVAARAGGGGAAPERRW